jgi:hypothetical protein
VKPTFLHTVYLIIIVLLVASMAWAWYHPKIKTTTTYLPGNTITKVETVTLPCHPIQTVKYKDRFIEKEKIPVDLVPKANEIIGETSIKPSETSSELVTSITPEGKVEFAVIPKQRALFSFENDKKIGLRYGFDQHIQPQIEIFGEYDFARVGNIYLGLYGEVNSNSEGKGMFQATYKF